MSIQAIQNNTVQWQCLHREDDDEPECGHFNRSSIDEVVYHPVRDDSRGAILRLPKCGCCGAHTDLNIGFSIKELFKVIYTVKNEQGEVTGYVLPYRHMHNIRLHAMLHERGSVAHPALLPMPPIWLLEQPAIAALPSEFFYSMWFAYGIMWQRKLLSMPFSEYFQDFTKLPLSLPGDELLTIQPGNVATPPEQG